MIRIAIHGTGRMAGAIAKTAADDPDVTVIAICGPQAPEWESDIAWYRELSDLPVSPDLLIDFTLPGGTLVAARWCASNKVPLLSGVTGLFEPVITALEVAAQAVPVLWSPNLSLGVNLLADLAARAAGLLDKDQEVIIEDIHHQWKKDAPSGTALMLGKRIAEQRSNDERAIEYQSIREGEVIGVHTITFRMAGEEFDLVHRAQDRSIYARGALSAGTWLTSLGPGMYSAEEWLSGRR